MAGKSSSNYSEVQENDEEARIQELLDYEILDTPDDVQFDRIAQIAAAFFEVPIVAISLIDRDRQWFKSSVGLKTKETPREISFCTHTIMQNQVLVIPDATLDDRFSQNPFVAGESGVRFYAGAPLVTAQKNRLGTLCVIDREPRHLTEAQIKILQLLSQQVMDLLEFKKAGKALRQKNIELEKAKADLHENAEFLSQVTNHLPIGLFCKDVKNNFSVKIWNKILSERSGIPAEKILGKSDFELFSQEDAKLFRQKDLQTIEKGEIDISEDVLDMLPVGRRHVRARKVPLKSRSGEVQYILGVVEDITEIKETQALLIEKSKMSSLGEMASGIAHEINNPLAIIRGRAQMISDMVAKQNLNSEALQTCAERIDETTVRIAKIISGLRNFAREGSEDPFLLTPLKEIIESSIEICNGHLKSNQIQIEVKGVSSNLVLECRSVQLSQVLVNLISNSIDALSKLSQRWIQIEIQQEDDELEIRFKDSGSGIPMEIRNRIMQPFFTTKEVGKGTGLGLSISKGIIESHHGSFYLDGNQPNTCFVIRLPRYQTPLTGLAAA